jgi:hypothetical protein
LGSVTSFFIAPLLSRIPALLALDIATFRFCVTPPLVCVAPLLLGGATTAISIVILPALGCARLTALLHWLPRRLSAGRLTFDPRGLSLRTLDALLRRLRCLRCGRRGIAAGTLPFRILRGRDAGAADQGQHDCRGDGFLSHDLSSIAWSTPTA